MKICEHCGARVDDSETKCPYCDSEFKIENNKAEVTKTDNNGDSFNGFISKPGAKLIVVGAVLTCIFPLIGVFVLVAGIAKFAMNNK